MAVDTGHGATAAFSSSTGYDNYLFTTIGLGGSTIPTIDTTHLGTTGFRTYIPGDLKDTNEISFGFRFDPEDQSAATLPVGTVQTLTITWPNSGGLATEATLTGTGFVTDYQFPELTTDTVQDGTMTFKFDGTTGPTFSEEQV